MSNTKNDGARTFSAPSGEGDEKLRSFTSTLKNELHDKLQTYVGFDPQFFAAARLYERTPKKMVYTTAKEVLDAKARFDFRELNASIPGRTINLDDDIIRDAADFIREALERYTRSINPDLIQTSLDLDHLTSLWRFGPGSARSTAATHFVDKICEETLSVTDECHDLAMLVRIRDPYLSVIDAKVATDLKKLESNLYKGWVDTLTVVEGSSLFTVPKNETTRRSAATEPLMNMACQLAVGNYIQGALCAMGLDITDQQSKNNLLAKHGSISGNISTLDLSNASDLIQPKLIEHLWPKVWYDLFMTTRSHRIKISQDDRHFTTLNMMSTMGNGFTFPMMTLTLLSLVYAVQSKRLKRRFYWDPRDTAVFGDDIIVPSADYEALCNVLQDAGLEVNLSKSYNTGHFRESCGGDYFYGLDITPFYVKSLSSDPEIYVAINQVLDWSVKTGISLLTTLEALRNMLHRPDSALLVPEWHNPDSGVLSPEVKKRYKYWDPSPLIRKKNPIREIPEAMMLMILGGYVVSMGHLVRYSVRNVDLTAYEMKSARLPSGFLAGTDSSKWNRSMREDRSCLLFLAGFFSGSPERVARTL